MRDHLSYGLNETEATQEFKYYSICTAKQLTGPSYCFVINRSVTTAKQTQPYLFWRQYGNVVLIDGARFLLSGALVDFLFEVFTGQPEQHIFLAVLRPQELPENVSTCWVSHELVEGLRPELDLFH